MRAGNEAIVYDGQYPVQWREADLDKFLLLIEEYPLYLYDLEANDPLVELFDRVEKGKRKHIRGIVTGIPLPAGYEQMRQTVVSAIAEHQQGADSVTELAVVLAKAVEAVDAYADFKALTGSVAVRFAIDTEFFMEVAKLRACRVLWQTMAHGYDMEGGSIPIVAETSLRSFAKYDPATNMLRTGNETLAAVLGGVDVFTVHPHLIVVHKADGENLPEAKRTVREYKRILHFLQPATKAWQAIALPVSSLEGMGHEAVWEEILKFKTEVQDAGFWQERREEQLQHWFHEAIEAALLDSFFNEGETRKKLSDLESDVLSGKLTVGIALERLFGEGEVE